MGLEKMGLPPKPSEKGKDWTPDATDCEGCVAAFTWINRKHHCRRCGGLFCNNCTLVRVYLRGQGDAPVRVCDPCRHIEEAAKFERSSRAKAPRGDSKASNKDDVADTLKHILKPEGKSRGDEVDLESILAGVADDDGDDYEVASPSGETAPVSPTRLHGEAQEEKKRFTALKKQGKDAEALEAFKRAKKLERQAEAREKEIRHQRRGSTGPLAGQHSKTSPSKEDHHGSPDAGLSRLRSEVGETQKKRRTPSQDLGKVKAEKDDFLLELKALGWSDKEIREAEKKPVVKSEEQLLAELAAEVRAKSEKAATSAAPGPTDAISTQITAHKRQALALKREGKLVEAKEELRKAKILEKQAEEMALLVQGEDEASDDDEIQALIRKLEREEKVKGNAGKGGASQPIPEDFGFDISFVGDDEDAHVEVDDNDLDEPDMAAALKAMGWEEDAAAAFKPQPKASKPTGPTSKEQILARKKTALALKREGKIAVARAELAEAKKMEQQLENQGAASAIAKAPASVSEPVFDEKIEEAEEKVEVTDEDMRDPEMMSALRAMGFGDNEPAHEAVVTKPNVVDESSLKQEILGIKRQALALKREGRVDEARDTLRRAKVLEQQLEDLQAVSQRQEETPALIKESRELRRGAQALPALSGVLNIGDEGEEDVEVDNADLVDPEIAAALAAMGWQEDPSDKLPVAVPKIEEPIPLAAVVSDPMPASLVVQSQIVETEKVEVKEVAAKEPEPIPSAATANHVSSTKTKSLWQQEVLGRKRRALALKRKGKSEEARIELQEAKIIEQQIADLDKGLSVTPPAVAESKPVAAQPPPPQQAFGNLVKQDPEPSRPVHLDDWPVDEVEVIEDDMQDPALLADLARVGWQGDHKEVAGPAKPAPVSRTVEKEPQTMDLGFSVAAYRFRIAAEKFRSAAEGYGRAVEESATASDEFEVATVHLRDVSNWLEPFRSAVRHAESEFQDATDNDPVATGTPVQVLAGHAIARLKKALVDAGPAELSVKAAKGRLATAQGQRRATDALLGPAKAALAAAEAELRAAGDQVRVAAHADVPVTVDEAVFAYREIANLKEIYDPADSLLKFAFEDWQRRQEDLAIEVSLAENKRADFTNQIFGLIGWYAVFQGVVLTAVAQLAQANWKEPGATPMCKKIRFPIILTAFSTAVIVGGILYKFRRLEKLEVTIYSEKAARMELEKRVNNLRSKGPLKFRFSKHSDNAKQRGAAPRAYWKNSIFAIVTLLAFTGLFILSYYVILCDKGAPENKGAQLAAIRVSKASLCTVG